MGFLDEAIGFQRHIQSVTANHFELAPDYSYLLDHHELEAGRFIRFLTDDTQRSNLTPDQDFLKSLSELLSPLLRSIKLHRGLATVRPTLGSFGASDRITDRAKLIAFEAYHFAERLKAYGDAVLQCLVHPGHIASITKETGGLINVYKRHADDWIRYRNFIVHGPKGRIDPFGELLTWELGAITLHNDLWLDYRNAFEESRLVWTGKAKSLVRAMLLALNSIEARNNRLIDRRQLSFSLHLGPSSEFADEGT